MSFALTTAQIRARTKTVTRRFGWSFLKSGDLIQAVEKAQGLKKGERMVRLAILRIRNIRREPLDRLRQVGYAATETALEGFPEMTGSEFLAFFARTHGCALDAMVARIEFEYVNPAPLPFAGDHQ